MNTPFVQFSVILYRVTSFRPTDNPEESAELVADSRIRAVLPRPELDFYWSTRLVPALEPEPLFGEIERLDDGREVDPWLVAPGFRTKRLAIGSLARLVDEFERLGRKPAAGNVLAFARRWTWLGHPQELLSPPDGPEPATEVRWGGRPDFVGERLSTWIDAGYRFAFLRLLWSATTALRSAHEEEIEAPASVGFISRHVRWEAQPWGTPPADWPRRNTARPGDRTRSRREGPITAFSYRIPLSPEPFRRWEETVVPAHRQPAVLRALRRDDYAGAATFVLGTEITQAIRGHVHVLVDALGHSQMRHAPDCLLAAAYLGFANEVAARSRRPRIRRCRNPECERGGTFHGRSNRIYCSRECKDHVEYLRRTGQLERRPNPPAAGG